MSRLIERDDSARRRFSFRSDRMIRKTKQPTPQSANLSPRQMELAIPKIDRRIADLEKFDVNSVNNLSDPRIDALEGELDTLLVSIFGAGTVEYERYMSPPITRLYSG